MKVLPLAFIWCVAFVTMALTCVNFSLIFWLSLCAFSFASAYMAKHRERFEREIDELFED